MLCRPCRPMCVFFTLFAKRSQIMPINIYNICYAVLHWTQKVIYNFDLHEGTLQRKLKCERFGQVRTTMLNQNAVTMGELYGKFNEVTLE
ncbi:MAG: hypothetical protein EZS28_053034 [Streblomastix strix]|uniref:Uncharacterized protein n=1 Tax=Streblomastix strix TaxID=222440 RepID=A0A5J4RPF3_9EUKA|nr:MAG: hypothetical protein EZS28_053034 [Streblomastix strix]